MNPNSTSQELDLTRIVKDELTSNRYVCLCPPGDPNSILIKPNLDRINIEICIFVYSNKINIKLFFPCRINDSFYPIICMSNAKYNDKKAFTKLNINRETGAVSMDYTYLTNANSFGEKSFWTYIETMINEATEEYDRITHIAVGMLAPNDKQETIELLEKTIELLQRI